MGADGKDQARVAAAVAERFERDGTGKCIKAAAAVFLRYSEPLKAHTATLEPEVSREDLLSIPFRYPAVQFQLGKTDDFLAQNHLLFGERKIH